MKIIGQYILENNKGYLFNNINNNNLELKFEFKIEFLKILLNYNEKSETEFYKNLNKIYCKCLNKNPFKIESITKTPSFNIMNNLDLYSCHKNEFEPLFIKKYKPREKGILWNIFYFTIYGFNIPTCCNNIYIKYETENIRKIFINEINFDIKYLKMTNNEEVIETLFYYFFKDLFKSCKEIKLGSLILKKLNDNFILLSTTYFNDKIIMCPSLQIEYIINNENYEIENIDINLNILMILKSIIKKNSINNIFSFLINYDFSSKIPINLIKK